MEHGPVEALPDITSDEDGLLDSSEHRNDRSLRARQIVYSDTLNGLRVRLAPEDRMNICG